MNNVMIKPTMTIAEWEKIFGFNFETMGSAFASQQVEIKPIDAKNLLKHHIYECQRTLRENNVNALVAAHHNNEYLDEVPTLSLAFNVKDIDLSKKNSVIRGEMSNGQHTLTAIVRANRSAKLFFKIHKCESEEKVNELYQVIDTGKSRTVSDVIKATKTQMDLPKKLSSALQSASTKWLPLKLNPAGYTNSAILPETVIQTMEEYQLAAKSFASWVEDTFKNNRPLWKNFNRATVWAAFLYYYKNGDVKTRSKIEKLLKELSTSRPGKPGERLWQVDDTIKMLINERVDAGNGVKMKIDERAHMRALKKAIQAYLNDGVVETDRLKRCELV